MSWSSYSIPAMILNALVISSLEAALPSYACWQASPDILPSSDAEVLPSQVSLIAEAGKPAPPE